MKSVSRGGKKRPPKISKSIQELLKESIRDELIISPPYNEFLTSWDENWSPWVVQRIAEVLSTKRRSRRYSWSASGAGRCLRAQEFTFLGMPTVENYDPQQRRIFLNGTWVHLRNQATLLEAGVLDNIEVTVKRKSRRARCTLDGMGIAKSGRYEGAEFGYELKSANEFSYNHQITKGAAEKTRMQVDFEFLLTGFDLFVIFNENKNNQGVQEWVFVRDEGRIKEVSKQLDELNTAVEYHRLHPQLPECKKRLKTGQFYKCPYGGDGGVCATSGNWPNRIPT